MHIALTETLIIIFFLFIIFLKRELIINRFELFDHPNFRKLHQKKVSLLGGSLIFSTFIFYCIVSAILKDNNFFLDLYFFSFKNFIFFILCLLVIFFIGLYDDKYKLQNIKKLIYLGLALIILFTQSQILQIDTLNFSFDRHVLISNLSIIFPTLFCLSIITAMNLYDGINLQSGVFYIINFVLLTLVLKKISFIILFISPLLLFLYLNFKNKLFLGDSGSNILSFSLIYFLLKSYNSQNYYFFDQILLIFFLPLVDAVRLFIYRLLKHGKPFLADKKHFHHLLNNKFGFFKTIIITALFAIIPHLSYIFDINTILLFFILFFTYLVLLNFAK